MAEKKPNNNNNKMSRKMNKRIKTEPELPAIPTDTSDDCEEIFEVEAILDKRFIGGKVCVSFGSRSNLIESFSKYFEFFSFFFFFSHNT